MKRTTVKDLRSIKVDERARLVGSGDLGTAADQQDLGCHYLLRAREAGLSWPLPAIYESEAA
ncbi:hypothetical protein J2R91_001412 [Bradyrhizobium japonicum]|nr:MULTISPECIES: hypothetical protein [Bradyrhizobium]MBR1033801.1 hypothetical protein [Bradyrhizobium liaoningense]MCP1774900.1 hypothetical protein [Bradyrhizobium japonicum]MCP1962100.1 hypothetical protein [Bradyrhizobium japonicum]